MLRPLVVRLPLCPYCGCAGLHGTVDQCLVALRAERDRLARLAAIQRRPT